MHVPLQLQGAGRFDNPDHYAALYAATEPAAAVGEAFGNLHTWSPAMFTRPKDELVRALVTFDAELRLIDLDDVAILGRLGLRPSDIVRRNQERTREVARRLWLEDHMRIRGLLWWSFYRPEWRPAMVWSRNLKNPEWFRSIRVINVEPLHIDHPTVRLAAAVLPRRVEP